MDKPTRTTQPAETPHEVILPQNDSASSEAVTNGTSVDAATAPREANPAAGTPREKVPSATAVGIWWMKLLLQPILTVAAVVGLFILLGLAQQAGFFFGGGDDDVATAGAAEDVMYVCPMACVPPSPEPGKCPVCGMNLKAQKQSGDAKDKYGLKMEPAAIRIANIRTAVAESVPLQRNIRAFGEISYDESSLATIAAYVDGRIETLFADYTGIEVQAGEDLAIIYSPELYSGQVGLLEAKKLIRESQEASARIRESNQRLYESSRQRLIELGLSEEQVAEVERSNRSDSRIRIPSPISGTVIEKRAVEGQYVKAGQPIYKVADLSTVWLILELFPQDAAHLRFGQRVLTRIQSRPGREFIGRINFIDPVVDSKSQTVRVRVVVPNADGLIKIGDYASATIRTTVNAQGSPLAPIYDPELAGKWISPRHPEILSDEPGRCPKCGIDLVPTSSYGFTDQPVPLRYDPVVPRSAVLMAGDDSVVYVETEPGRFEFRSVKVGELLDDRASILEGVEAGEQVVATAAILVDSQFNMSGKPSLVDPNRAIADDATETLRSRELSPEEQAEIDEALSELNAEDRALAEKQKICPVTEAPLGSMGVPIKIQVEGRTVFICCQGCESAFREEPQKYFDILAGKTPSSSDDQTIALPDLSAPSTPDSITPLPTFPDASGSGTDAESTPTMELPVMTLPDVSIPDAKANQQDGEREDRR